MILDHLNELRENHPECLAVSLIDLSSGLALRTSAKEKYTQERLDALCSLASELFEGNSSEVFSKALDSADQQDGIVMTNSQTCLLLRSSADPMEAMFCICSPKADHHKILQSARVCLDKISSVQ